MSRLHLIETYNFEPCHNKWLSDLALQDTLIPRHWDGPVLFSLTPTLNENGVYEGHSYVRCYGFEPKPKRIIPNGGPTRA